MMQRLTLIPWLREHHIGTSGSESGILVALSGGADSVCLLSLLKDAADNGLSLKLRAVHVHHGIRGEEADRDAAFVERLCDQWKIEEVTRHVDVPSFAKSEKCSTEEAARILRYRVLEEELGIGGENFVAAAHHKEDQEETILWNLLRGSGLKGMSGMEEQRGHLIRPMLSFSKKDILKYLTEKNLSWCEDSTNQSSEYTRNRIRKELIPLLEDIRSGSGNAILRMAGQARLAEEYLTARGEEALQSCIITEDTEFGTEHSFCEFSVRNVQALPEAVRLRMLYLALTRLSGRQKDLSEVHVNDLHGLFQKTSGREIHLPYGMKAIRKPDTVLLTVSEACDSKEREERLRQIREEYRSLFRAEVIPVSKLREIPQNACVQTLSYDKIKRIPIIRTRESTDRICVYRDGKSRKLQDFLVDQKIPSELRDEIPVVAVDHRVIWIPGIRAASDLYIDENTKEVLLLKWKGKLKWQKKNMSES